MRTAPSAGAPAGRCALGAPIENTSDPPTGWPSAEITRQLSTWLPREMPGRMLALTVVFSLPTGPSATGAPSAPGSRCGPRRRRTSGATGALNVSIKAAGGAAITAPSAGSARMSAACARASPAAASRIKSAHPSAISDARGRTSHLREKLQRRRRLGIVARGFARRRNLDPAMHALLALLHRRDIEHLARLEIARQEAAEHELVV